MLKKSLFILLLATIFAAFISCDLFPKEDQKQKIIYNSIEVKSWPENVDRIVITRENDLFSKTFFEDNYYTAKYDVPAGTKISVQINYKQLDNNDTQYFGIGTLENEEEEFKVFINGNELYNDAPYELALNGEDETNAKLSFEGKFSCSGEKTEITFENSPKKILKSELSLRLDNIYSFFDFTEISEDLIVNLQDVQANGTKTDCERLSENGMFYVNTYSEILLTISPKEGYKILTSDFKANDKNLFDSNNSDKIFTYTFEGGTKKEHYIKVTGGNAVPQGLRYFKISDLPEDTHIGDLKIMNSQGNQFLRTDYSFFDNDGTMNSFTLYLGYNYKYGNLTTDENPVKVFINGKEYKNEYPYSEEYFSHLDTNLQCNFQTTFESTDDIINITIQNEPRLINSKEIRLLDDSNYCYFDFSELGENLRRFNIFKIKDGERHDCFPLDIEAGINGEEGLNIADLTSPLNITIYPNNGYYIDNYDFMVNGEPFSDIDNADDYFEGVLTATRTAGEVIKISGGKVSLLNESDFSGKTFCTTSITCSHISKPDISSIIISITETGSVSIRIDDNEYSGKIKINGDGTCLISSEALRTLIKKENNGTYSCKNSKYFHGYTEYEIDIEIEEQ